MRDSVPHLDEAVCLLRRIDPAELTAAMQELPALATEFRETPPGGITTTPVESVTDSDGLGTDRAKFFIRTLNVAVQRAQKELESLRQKIRIARKVRFAAKCISILGSSAVLAAVAWNARALEIGTAVLALLATLGISYAEHKESLFGANSGDIYLAYENSTAASFKALLMGENLKTLVKHHAGREELSRQLDLAHELCAELNHWLDQIAVQ